MWAQRGEGLAQGHTAKLRLVPLHKGALMVSGLSFTFCPNHGRPEWLDGDLARRPSRLGDMTLECVGETGRLLFQA